jgi:hypothetical protein
MRIEAKDDIYTKKLIIGNDLPGARAAGITHQLGSFLRM